MSTVLITGAAGRIGHYLRAGLPGLGWQLRLLDRVPIPEEAGSIAADVTDPAALRAAVAGVSAVVHLAGAASTSSSFEEVLPANIVGTYQVIEAARVAGVRRVIYASSNHANGFSPRSDSVTPGVGDRPDSYYGVSKIFGEALGRFYADRYGMQVACLRIGSCTDRPTSPRMLGSWLSPADAVRLVDACLRSPDLGYAVVYGISRNARRWWDLRAAEALGYQPQDDAEEFAAEVLAPYGGIDPGSPQEPQGGDAVRRVQSAGR
jgi:uronate dehydrogenase